MQRPTFVGNDEDLAQFMKLATSPVRSTEREQALQQWEDYKLTREIEHVRSIGGRFGKARLLAENIRVIDLRGAWLDGMCVGYANLRGVRLDGASVRGAWLKGADLQNASLTHADFTELVGDRIEGGYAWGYARLGFASLIGADATGALFTGASMVGANFRDCRLVGADLRACDLSNAVFVGSDLQGAALTGSRIHGISAWDLQLCENDELRCGLTVTKEGDPPIQVDDLEVAQFIYLLLNRPKLRNVINAVTRRGVLILGRFSNGGLDVLESIAESLRLSGYVPIIFDFDRPDSRDYTETVKLLAGLSRFIVADLSGGSVPHELVTVVPHLEIPVVAVLDEGTKEYSMFRDLQKYRWVVPDVVRYTDRRSLQEAVPGGVIAPAEAIIAEKMKRLELYT